MKSKCLNITKNIPEPPQKPPDRIEKNLQIPTQIKVDEVAMKHKPPTAEIKPYKLAKIHDIYGN